MNLENNSNSSASEPIDSCLDNLRKIYEANLKTIHRLEQENAELKDQHYKDREIQRLHERLNRLTGDIYRGFPITKEEKEKIDAWMHNHIHKKHWKKQNYHTKCGPVDCSFSYQFYPTHLDTIQIVKCSCGAEFQF